MQVKPQVILVGLLDVQVCVPKDWTEEQVRTLAEQEVRSGTANGWQIRREGDPWLAGDPERARCEADPDWVHIMLDA